MSCSAFRIHVKLDLPMSCENIVCCFSSEGRTNLVGIGTTQDLDEGPPRPLTILSIDGSSSTVNVRSSSSNALEDGQLTGRSSR